MKYNNFYIKYILPDSILLADGEEYSQELEFHGGIYKILLIQSQGHNNNKVFDFHTPAFQYRCKKQQKYCIGSYQLYRHIPFPFISAKFFPFCAL